MLVAKLRGARERMRARGKGCEGPLPFGRDEGEQEILRRLKELRASGLTLFAQVAEQASAERLPRALLASGIRLRCIAS